MTPRAPEHPIPGFDVGPGTPNDAELVAEQLNTAPWGGGTSAGSQCRVAATELVYRISAYRDDSDASTGERHSVWEFGAVIDRPAPLDVGVIGDTVVILAGPADATAPTIADVLDADEETWRQLLLEDEAPGGIPQPIGESVTATVDFVPIDDTSTRVSSLTFRVVTTDGVASFHIDTTDAVVAAEAEYWKIEISDRIRSRSTATHGESGGVMGVRLGDAPVADPFTATVSTTDGDDQTIQTTGPILLHTVIE